MTREASRHVATVRIRGSVMDVGKGVILDISALEPTNLEMETMVARREIIMQRGHLVQCVSDAKELDILLRNVTPGGHGMEKS